MIEDIDLSGLELFWLILNSVTLLVAIYGIIDARRGRQIVEEMGGEPVELSVRRIVARENIRRDVIRVICQSLLLGIAVPAIFSDRVITLTPILSMLLLLACALAAQGLMDLRERQEIRRILAADEEARLLREDCAEILAKQSDAE